MSSIKIKKFSLKLYTVETREETGISTLEDETITLSRNVGHQSPSDATPPPRATGTSISPLKKMAFYFLNMKIEA
jgi:hypothetical protein